MANHARNSQDDNIEHNNNSGPLENLCSTCLLACEVMTPLIASIYDELILTSSSSTGSDGVQKTKKDNSAFTIADGTVQRLLIKCLFSNVAFRDIVGEEDEGEEEDDDIDDNWWYQVQGLTIPKHLQPLVDSTRIQIESLAKNLLVSNSNESYYSKLTVFIDPIDGTREFSNGKGEQCSICIGFADVHGKAIAGVVYRPLSKPSPTWVAGAKSDGYAAHNFEEEEEQSTTGAAVLSTNGSISKFVESLIVELDVPRIKAGGAGNKMMMLLQQSISVANKEEVSKTHRGHLYIQDRGVSRWDTCAAEACLNAFGGQLLKLTDFLQDEEDGYYTYLASKTNLDFVPNTANLTKYNSNLQELPSPAQKAQDVCQVKAYSNLAGLVAFGKEFNTQEGRKYLRDAIRKAAANNAPSLD
eukprot:scaffold10654_cov190-Skeletonema_dohrnii-CCMP3373.AAC.3